MEERWLLSLGPHPCASLSSLLHPFSPFSSPVSLPPPVLYSVILCLLRTPIVSSQSQACSPKLCLMSAICARSSIVHLLASTHRGSSQYLCIKVTGSILFKVINLRSNMWLVGEISLYTDYMVHHLNTYYS